MAVHATGIVIMAIAMLSIRSRVEARSSLRFSHLLAVLIGVISVLGLLLAVLHGIEAGMWAVAFWWLGALNSPADAILYSVDTLSTRGASGLTIERHWEMMGALEATDGMLLFGISTAFIFTVIQAYWPMLSRLSRD
jgi:hypothetical protein